MIRKLPYNQMGKSDLGWLHSTFHFSFADYYNPNNINFGKLRVVNDDQIEAQGGFPTHPHQDMEIVSYVVEGELTHADSMGNERVVKKGQVQYMSAGTGVTHSEFNYGKSPMRLLQIWVYPDKRGYVPNYGDYDFPWEARENKWLQLVSSTKGEAPVKIHQDMNIYVQSIEEKATAEFPLEEGRQVYFIQIEGTSQVNGVSLHQGDAAEITGENLVIQADSKSHVMVFEMKQE